MTPWTLALKLMQLPPPVRSDARDVLLKTLAKRDNTIQGIRQATCLGKGEIAYELGQLVKEGLVESRKELRGSNLAVVWGLVKERKDEDA